MSIRKIKKEDYEQIKALELQVHQLHQKARPDVFKKEESGVLNYDYFLQLLNTIVLLVFWTAKLWGSYYRLKKRVAQHLL